MAREADKYGSRTVGVVTKCDMIVDTTEVGETQLSLVAYSPMQMPS
jgi:hypothetical protein